MFKLNGTTKKFDTLAVLLLFFLFSATAFTLILLGIKQYKQTADSMNVNYEIRTATSYLTEKVRQYDTSSQISIVTLDGVDALALKEEYGDNKYITYIYYYDGFIRELYVSEDSVFDLACGMEIIEATDMTISKISDFVYNITLISTDNENTDLVLATKSS